MHASSELRNTLALRAPDAWLTPDEAAVYLGRSRGTVRNLVSSGHLRPDGRGPRRASIFKRSTLDAFLERGGQR